MFSFIISRWKESLALNRFRVLMVTGLILTAAVTFLFSWFLEFIQLRPGYSLNDPFLARISPWHLCDPILICTYLTVVVSMGYLSVYPSILLRFTWAFSFLLIMRACCLFIVPLEPPPRMIELRDVFLEASVYSGEVITKDLFFSGHVAILCLFGLLIQHRRVKAGVFIAAGVTGVMLLMQHVHYAIDIAVAPLFAAAARRLTYGFI